MADLVYNRAKKEMWDGTVDLVANTIKYMLVDSGYTADDAHDFVDMAGANDPIDQELSGTGYTAGWAGSGRKTLAGKSIVEDDTNNRAEFNFSAITWTSISAGVAAAGILHKHGTSDDTDGKLIAYNDSGGFPVTTNSGDVTLTPNTEGFLQLA